MKPATTRRNVLRMLGVALTDFTRNNCPYMAAGIAYWTLFSLFPLALAAMAILGFFYSSPEDQRRVADGIVNLVPVSEDYLAALIDDVMKARGAIGVLAVAGLLWTGSAVFSAVRKGVNHAWHIGMPHYFLHERAIDFVMLLGVAALASLQVVFTTNLFGAATVGNAVTESSLGIAVKLVLELFALAVAVGAFLLLYRYVPNTEVKWRDVWHGALVAALLFQSVRIVFTWFISSYGKLNIVYGSLGALMAVLVWAYFSGMAIMWGAQLAYTYRGVFGTHAGEIVLPPPKPKSKVVDPRPRIIRIGATLLSWLLPPKKAVK